MLIVVAAILDTTRAGAVNLVVSKDRRGMIALHHLRTTTVVNDAETVEILLDQEV